VKKWHMQILQMVSCECKYQEKIKKANVNSKKADAAERKNQSMGMPSGTRFSCYHEFLRVGCHLPSRLS
jgi:hypothetical protein